MATPLISVLMPVYNAAHWLESAIASVQAQSGTDFEIIAVDDGSNDRSKLILDHLAARDPRIVHQRAVLPAVGARGVQTQQRRALAGLFEINAVFAPEQIEMHVAADDRLKLRGHA